MAMAGFHSDALGRDGLSAAAAFRIAGAMKTESSDETLETTFTCDDALDDTAAPLGIVITWSRDDPTLLGAYADAPTLGESASVLGRDDPEDTGPRIALRIGDRLLTIASRRLSRRQLRLEAVAAGRLTVENIGRRDMRVDGHVTRQAVLEVGAVVEVERALQFLVVHQAERRPRSGSWSFGAPDPHGLIGESDAMMELRSSVRATATTPGHVWVVGPEGVGKERVAHAIHATSPRTTAGSNPPLVARAAATIPEALFEETFFGASGDPPRVGLLAQANGTSLLLDEIGGLAALLAARLGRFLDVGTFHPLGATEALQSDARIIATTRHAPETLPRDLVTRFRHIIRVPEMDARRGDIPLLARATVEAALTDAQRAHLCDPETGVPRVSAAFIRALLRHPLAGGVRELVALVRTAVSTARGERVNVTPEMLETQRRPAAPHGAAGLLGRTLPVDLPDAVRTGVSELTKTEVLVLQHLAQNKTSRAIAADLFVSVRTVQNHRARICTKLELHGANRLLGVAMSLAEVLGPPPPGRS
ncbi:MAG: DNA-binding NtrC family response regulator [Myxococcota bacterium]|jgi:DNA-binding NtrC family response regulator